MNNTLTSYQEACKYLDDLQMHKIKLGLEAMRSILTDLGSPEEKCSAVHVAGTNGKGSVCSMLRSICSEAGYKTGLYTSPHLSSVRERFRIDDCFIGTDDFTRLMEHIRLCLAGRSITYFECVTALAFLWFAEQHCDLVILETGMGGRLDATNVVTPVVSVITNISLDHEQYLGDTIEAVAYEKAGIIKAGVPVVSGVTENNARVVIEDMCKKRGAPLVTRGTDFLLEPAAGTLWTWKGKNSVVELSGLTGKNTGTWEAENCSCAIGTVMALRDVGYAVSERALSAGLSATRWPGRMEYLEVAKKTQTGPGSQGGNGDVVRFLLDGAHNPAGVEHLIATVKSRFTYDRLFLVWASMGDKKYDNMLRAMAREADCLLLTRPGGERSAKLADLTQALLGAYYNELQCFDTVQAAQREVMKRAGPDDLVVVAGSLFLIGEFRPLLVGEVVQ